MKDTRIKVCIRARPLLPVEKEDSFIYSGSSIKSKTAAQAFTFDEVFPPSTDTTEIYSKVAQPLITKILEGYNGTILAYGQTTSGKTFTMSGTPLNPGIIMLASQDIFNRSLPDDFKVTVSYLEIYNERVNDLLQPYASHLKIREDPSDGCFVPGLHQRQVIDAEDLIKLLSTGEKNRQYRATNIHEHSSRSHTIFRMVIESKHENKNKMSVLNLVDLAGSERLNESGGGGVETGYINKSLFVLTNVIHKLSENPGLHIPYRDSKLTRLLSGSLGGNAFTTIICTIAPNFANLSLSLSTLRLVSRAKNIRNAPVINEVCEDDKIVEKYKIKCHRLESQMQDMLRIKDREIERLRSENNKLKSKNSHGFEAKKSDFEKKYHTEQLENWEKECQKLRENYVKEQRLIDEKYSKKIASLYQKLKPNRRNSTMVREKVSRPVSQPKSENRGDRVHKQSSCTTILNSAPQEIFNPPPQETPPEQSLEAINKDTPIGENVILFGLNNEGSCSTQSHATGFTALTHLYSKISCGYFHNALIDENGLLYTFGKNSSGQLGIRTLKSQSIPSLVSHPLRAVPVSSVSCGWLHTLCVTQSGELYGWGSNGDGQLGTGDEYDRSWPVLIETSESVLKVSAGRLHSACILQDNSLLTWGANPDGRLFKEPVQIKHGVYETIDTPVKVSSIQAKTVALGFSHTVVVDLNGNVHTAGATENGQLGIGEIYSTHSAHGIIVTLPRNVKQIACGDRFSCFLMEDGKLFTCGKGSLGRLGLGDEVDRDTPCLVPIGETLRKISCGGRHCIALTESGNLYGWGYGFCNQLGNRKQADLLLPEKLDLNYKHRREARTVKCGYMHTAAILY